MRVIGNVRLKFSHNTDRYCSCWLTMRHTRVWRRSPGITLQSY